MNKLIRVIPFFEAINLYNMKIKFKPFLDINLLSNKILLARKNIIKLGVNMPTGKVLFDINAMTKNNYNYNNYEINISGVDLLLNDNLFDVNKVTCENIFIDGVNCSLPLLILEDKIEPC